MKIKRHKTKKIKIGNIYIGGNAPVAIQSMTKTKTHDTDKTIRQIHRLKACGCEIVRLSLMDIDDAKAIRRIKRAAGIPLVADTHFNWRLALQAIDAGIDKIRLNPGNIYRDNEIKEIVRAAKAAHIPIRVGVNSGSIRTLNTKKSLSDQMVKTALDYARKIEKMGFSNIAISLKSADIFDTIEAYRVISRKCNYPLHLGLTATGLPASGIVKSSIALGSLLSEGIGDTIRISLTDAPQEEVKVAKYILRSLGLRRFGPEIISCPTCGRCNVDLIKLVKGLEDELITHNSQLLTRPLKVAIMGCAVNGPGEARQADIGIAFEKQKIGLFFKKGRQIRRVPFKDSLQVLIREQENL